MKSTRFGGATPILNASLDCRHKLIDCNTVSGGYFDTLWAFVDAFLNEILDLEVARPKTKGHTVVRKNFIIENLKEKNESQ